MRGAEYADVLFVLQVFGNKADAVPCECLRKSYVWMNVYQLINNSAKRYPDHMAIMEGDVSVSYDSLMTIIDAIAKDLHEFGIAGGHRVGLCFPNSIAYIAITYALWKLDAAVVPIDTALKESEVAQICDSMRITSIICFSNTAGSIRRQCPEIHTLFYFRKIQHSPQSISSNKHIAFVRFTSGTTGKCKGVVLTHGKIIQRIGSTNKVLHINAKDTVIWLLSMAHHFVSTIVLYLSKGAAIILANGFWAGSILKKANQMKATLIYASPFHYTMLANDQSGLMLPDIRLAISTTINLPDTVYEKFFKRYAIPIVQAYGIIEIGLICINTKNHEKKIGSVGSVLPDYKIKINTVEEPLSQDRQCGELFFSGPGFFDAYFDPWIDAGTLLNDGWFETGDIGWIDDDGYVYICGRKNDVINTAGMKVFPQEIENQLNRHPKIAECCVYGKKHDRLGEVIAVDVVLEKAGKPLTETEIQAYCRQKMASYKVPETIQIVGQIKKTLVTSKIIRRKPH